MTPEGTRAVLYKGDVSAPLRGLIPSPKSPLVYFLCFTMRSLDPSLPSISFVLSQSDSRPRHVRRRPSMLIHRSKSSPSFSPHRPLYPPQLDSDFLMNTVDYRFAPPPRPPSRSSFALPRNIFDTEEVEIEIIPASPIESESSLSSYTSTSSSSSARRKLRAYLQVCVPRSAGG
ncbi:hypothetical protein BV25DRAFT_352293 [Artomyces pyxidatus]|uniref:Uncharacterized protein n=1 Tax=Artomyces pyxidatus TaxID=48021 RepID=A0ACB8SEH0_9AGAM|nr:hypothetical protein BV25DRAFT_352293 [Artomyces pyxidatus]